jgi:hypothetical protein
MSRELRMSVTLDRILKFEASLAVARTGIPDDVDPFLWEAQIAGMESMLESLRREYEELPPARP